MVVQGHLFLDVDQDGVWEEGDKPVAYERLILEREGYSLAYMTYTDSVGRFIFPPVPPARYYLYLGTNDGNAPLEVIDAAPEQVVVVNISLPVRQRVFIPYLQR